MRLPVVIIDVWSTYTLGRGAKQPAQPLPNFRFRYTSQVGLTEQSVLSDLVGMDRLHIFLDFYESSRPCFSKAGFSPSSLSCSSQNGRPGALCRELGLGWPFG